MRSSDTFSSFSAFASSVLYCSSSGRSGLLVGAALSLEALEGVGCRAVAISAADGVESSAIVFTQSYAADVVRVKIDSVVPYRGGVM